MKVNRMKLVVAIFRPPKLTDVRDALEELGLIGFTFSEMKGFGKHRGETDIYRGIEYSPSYVHMMEIKLIVDDEVVEQAVKAIADAAKTEESGDGKIYVTEITHTQSISTGKTEKEAF